MSKKVCVIGLGYIGLPTAVMFANHGFSVHGVDVNEKVVTSIAHKRVHIEEPGLEERLTQAVDAGLFTASTTPTEADVFIIAVPSPINSDKSANVHYVRQATEAIVPYVKEGNLVILESTVPPKTVDDVMIPVLKKTGLLLGEELYIAHSPERVIPGKLFDELVNNDRIVGGINEKSAQLTKELYRTFVKGEIHLTDATTAEMVKVIENTYRDVNIAFANELAKISHDVGVNVWEAIRLANFHPRVNIHFPGPGVGGHCIAVDPWFLVDLKPELAEIVHLARQINDGMPRYTANLASDVMRQHGVKHPKVAVLGLAFKGNIDDMRESPALFVIDELKKQQIDVVAYDPHITENKLAEQTQELSEAVNHADLVLILTDHHAFKELDIAWIKSHMRSHFIIDTKNCLDLSLWEEQGFGVYLLGNGKHV